MDIRRRLRRCRRVGRALALGALRGDYRGLSHRELRALLELLWLGATDENPLPLFDASFYLERYPETAGCGLSPLVHYLRFGAIEQKAPHPLFDTGFYCRCYADVATSGRNPLVHFLLFGAAEQRNPHPLFDTAFYLHRYPQVATAGLNPLVHFVLFGAAERRNPHPLFDAGFYLDRYPEVARSGRNPLVHFLQPGDGAERQPHPLFDVAFFRGQQPAETSRAANPLIDYLARGSGDDRSPHPLFHPRFYLDRNPDVARAGTDALVHYVSFGAPERRQPHPLFDPSFYCERVGGLPPGVDALSHFLASGGPADPHPLFETAFYGEQDPQLRATGINPLVHYVLWGAREGRATRTAQRLRSRTIAPPAPGGRHAGATPEDSRRAAVVVRGGGAENPPTARTADATAAVMRLLAGAGFDVRVAGAAAPHEQLAATANVDVVLAEAAAAAAAVPAAMALHPCCRLVLLQRDGDAGRDAGLDAVLPYFDAVIGAGGASGRKPLLLLDRRLAGNAPSAADERAFVALLRKAGVPQNIEHSDRLEEQARVAARSTQADVIFFANIGWRYRFQRPQQLALALARLGRRVVYVEAELLGGHEPRPYLLQESPAEGVFVLRLRVPGALDIHGKLPDEAQTRCLRSALDALNRSLALREPALVVQAPFWHALTGALPRQLLVYDCMDLYAGFANARPQLVAFERELLSAADLVVLSSAPLVERMEGAHRLVVVRNGCDFERFAAAEPQRESTRPVVGYVGAIDRWFDVALVERCALAHADWEFVLAGSSLALPPGSFRPLPNLRLLGEIDYDRVPELVAGFDVCIVPFLDNELTRCVNPVKVYEYLAAGKPVVATALPELAALEPGLVHVARSHDQFDAALELALAERDDAPLAARRRAWASGHDWSVRGRELIAALERR